MTSPHSFPALRAERYVVPLREGGSLPAVVETEGGGQFVVKFRGSGQGAKALLAELIVARLAELLELPVPAVALIELDECFGRLEPDPEIQDILKGSRGWNVGLQYLEGAYNFDPASDGDKVPNDLASRIVCLDALCWNIDRTARNPNLMVWRGGVWLIDHGAALYVHHDWSSVRAERIEQPFSQLGEHVLLERTADLPGAVQSVQREVTSEPLEALLAAIPDELLTDAPAGVRPDFESAQEARVAYARLLTQRVRALPGVVGVAT